MYRHFCEYRFAQKPALKWCKVSLNIWDRNVLIQCSGPMFHANVPDQHPRVSKNETHGQHVEQ